MNLAGQNALTAFQTPPSELRPVPWWGWKGSLEFPEMLRQLDLMKEQRVLEFFIFGSTTLRRPVFFSEEWFEYVAFTLKEAEKRGMKVWIYDDLNWPSGSGGGALIKNHPEKREFQLRYAGVKLAPGAFRTVDPVGLLLMRQEDADGVFHEVEIDEFGYFSNRTDRPVTLHTVHRKPLERSLLNAGAAAGGWGQRGQLDLLDPEAFQLWVDYVYGEYERRFGQYFGTLIRGFFTDEPQAHSFEGSSAPFNAAFRREFQARCGYDPVDQLLKLFLQVPGAEAFRRDYYGTLTELFSSNFAKLNAWCAKRDLLFTGHCIYEEVRNNMQSFVLRNGDPHRMLSKFSAPGCDLLGHTVPYLKEQPGIHRKWAADHYNNTIYTAKFVASTARWSGAERTMCEAFGVRNGHSGIAGQKLINDFLAAAGINLVNDNTLVYTLSELERGSKSFSVPWWHLYHLFTDTSARLSCFASFGKLAAKTAVMVPLATIWSRTRPVNWTGGEFASQAEVFNRLGELLWRSHIDFEYIFEDAPDAEALKVFDTILLPAAEFMTPEVAAKLNAFRSAGGKVVTVAATPELTDGSGVCVFDGAAATPEEALGFVPKAPYAIEGEGAEDVLAILRSDGTQFWLLVANQTAGTKTLTLRHELGDATELLDPETGRICRFPARDGARTLILAEEQSVIVRIADAPTPGALPRAELATLPAGAEREVLRIEGDWAFDFECSNLAFPALELRFDPLDRGLADRWYDAPPAEWFPVIADQMPFNICQKECMYYWMRGKFTIAERVPDNLAMVFSNATIQNVFVNGAEIASDGRFAVYDHENRRYPIAAAAHPGENEFYLRIQVSLWNDPELLLSAYQRDMVLLTMLFGDFAVAPDGTLCPPPRTLRGDGWARYGLASLAKPGVYRKTFRLDRLPAHPVLVLDEARSTVEVVLNGVALAPRAWRPFRFDLRDALRVGENELEIRVAAGFGNILKRGSFSPVSRGAAVDYGILGPVRIVEAAD